jgi:hypothetical protein
MPFKNFKQQQAMFINAPKVASKWAAKYGTLDKNNRPSKNKWEIIAGTRRKVKK